MRKGLSQFAPLAERFEAQVERITESGCWIWTGTVSAYGYGQIKDHYRTRASHRVAFELFKGRLAEGLQVCHSCDVRCCVNPAHLFSGTAFDNMRDAVRKGKQLGQSGEKHHQAKLTADIVRAIRESSEMGITLATLYRVDPATISEIRTGRKWKQANQRSQGKVQ